MDSLYSALIPDVTAKVQAQLAAVLNAFPKPIIRRVADFGGIVRALKPRERYCELSPALRRLGIDVDGWPVPPAGLFVVEERTAYIRRRSSMTIAHEFGHAIDCVLGGGVYLSSVSPEIRRAFLDARRFVTPYAATGIDEYFAESIRAFVEVNDSASHWPKATKSRLQSADPAMYDIVGSLLSCAT